MASPTLCDEARRPSLTATLSDSLESWIFAFNPWAGFARLNTIDPLSGMGGELFIVVHRQAKNETPHVLALG
jgi:hypothetical protein